MWGMMRLKKWFSIHVMSRCGSIVEKYEYTSWEDRMDVFVNVHTCLLFTSKILSLASYLSIPWCHHLFTIFTTTTFTLPAITSFPVLISSPTLFLCIFSSTFAFSILPFPSQFSSLCALSSFPSPLPYPPIHHFPIPPNSISTSKTPN